MRRRHADSPTVVASLVVITLVSAAGVTSYLAAVFIITTGVL